MPIGSIRRRARCVGRRRSAGLVCLVSLACLAAVGSSVASAATSPAPLTAPQNPFLAPNPFSNLHNDTWMSNVYTTIAGPTAGATTAYGPYPPSICASLLFDGPGRIVSVCPGLGAPVARIIDPTTLAVLASYELPTTDAGPTGYQDFTGGGYIFLDQHGNLWTTTRTQHVYELRVGATGFTKLADYDLSKVLKPDQGITSALPDFSGNIWFVTKTGGTVGVLNTHTGRIRVTHADSEIENSFAVGSDGIYIVSEKSLYRFNLGPGGKPVVTWRVTYPNSGIHKPGQVDAGSGTTPTVIPGGMVAIADNADPMDVVVYRTAAKLPYGNSRMVCTVAVFHKGASDTENSLIGDGRSLVVENNYGYQGYAGAAANIATSPGFARVDVNADGTACRRVWQTFNERGSTVVPKLSTRSGLIYTYTHASATAPWAWTALSFKTGRTAFSVPTGTGASYNNNYASIALGPTGNAYLGTIGGITELRRP